ncbi:MAG: coproporphyrinogen III oxidase family protein [Defluviitaleaceae bacterium]|nr:coproporphyrinogen III oxidase family protein [Defluviitaleaceae bacterium]
MNYNRYDVAVMNYPLFNPRESAGGAMKNMFTAGRVDTADEMPVYIHIPFCGSLCDFCIYNRTMAAVNDDIINRYVDALIREINMYASSGYFNEAKAGAVFIGGGTPTVLTAGQLGSIISALRDGFNLGRCEITVECNVQSADMSKLASLKELGVTRISTGVQTFNDCARKQLNIKKSAQEIIEWINGAKKLMFDEVSIDLIYGFPQINHEEFSQDISRAIALELGHISIYKLTMFAFTKLYHDVINGKVSGLPTKDELYRMFADSHQTLTDAGYCLTSTQEYSRRRSVRFWDLTYSGYGDNLSFGVSSFGYVNGFCYQNENDISRYIKKINKKMLPIERISNRITGRQLMERAMVIGFRKGFVSNDHFHNKFGKRIEYVFSTQIEYQLNDGLIRRTDNGYELTPKGVFYQGNVSAEFMVSIFEGISPLKKKMCVGKHEMP